MDSAPRLNVSPWKRWLGSPWLILPCGAMLLFARCPDRVLNPQFWAEDGIFFFWAREGGLRMLAAELAGYLQLGPRAIAAASQLVSPLYAPHVYVGCALAATLYVMSRALSARCPLAFKPIAALAIIVMPDAGEILLRGGNVQWVLGVGLLLLLISADAGTPRQRFNDYGSAVVFGLSGPFSVLLAPGFVLRAVVRRTQPSTVLASLVSTCAIVQLAFIATHPQPIPAGAHIDSNALAAVVGIRLGRDLFLPAAPLPGSFLLGLVSISILGWVAWLGLRSGEEKRTRILLTVGFAALLGSTIYRSWHSLPELCNGSNGDRYFYLLELLMVWLLLFQARSEHPFNRRVAGVAFTIFLLASLGRQRVGPMSDLQWQSQARPLSRGEAATVTINPGWKFTFPARQR